MKTLSSDAGNQSFFWSPEITDMDALALQCLSSPKSALMQCNASMTMRAIFANYLILVILAMRCFSQILPFVIARVSVFMVDQIFRPSSSHIEPCQSVGAVEFLVETDRQISIRTAIACWSTGRVIAAARSPRKDTRLRVIVQKFAQTLRGKIGLSHATLLSSIGQRPAAIHSHVRASLLSLRLGQAC